jgi:hypothetical protein
MKYLAIIVILSVFPSCGLYYVANPQVKTIESTSGVLPVNTIIKTKFNATIYLNPDRKDKNIYTGFAIIPIAQKAPETFKVVKRLPKNSPFVIKEYIREFDGQHAWYYVKIESTESHLKNYPIVRMIGQSQLEVANSLDDFTW